MKINLESLKNLCFTHSVSGDTLEIIDYLASRLKKLNISYEVTPFGVLVFGNREDPKVMISAHADEVGFQVVKRNKNGTFMVKKVGHVEAVMLNNSPVYVQTEKGMIQGTFHCTKELGNNKPEHFTEIFLDTVDNDSIQIGDFGSYARTFSANEDKIIACALDNKISVEMVLELVEEHPEMLKDVLFAFVTEEELKYDCILGLSALFTPEYALVLDMLPVNQSDPTRSEALPELGKGPGVLYGTTSYQLQPLLRKKLKESKLKHQVSFVDLDFQPEPQMMQRNGITKGMNVFIPLYGWHTAVSTAEIKDFVEMKKFVFDLQAYLLKN